MRLGVKAIAALAGGMISGFASVHAVMENSTPGNGLWRDRQSAVADGNPYALARLLLAGKLPTPSPALAEFTLERDADGAALDSDCIYRISGRMPQVLWWSLSTGSRSGDGQATTVTANNVVFEQDGSTIITISREPHSGNAIAPPGEGVMTIRLRLLRADASSATIAPTLTIARGACT